MYRVAIVVFAIIGTSFAQEVVKGKCPSVKVVEPFTVSKIGGSWYEWGRYGNKNQTADKCSEDNYVIGNNGKLDVTYTAIDGNGKAKTLTASTVVTKPIGQLNMTIHELGIASVYNLLGTDYTNWATFFVCKEQGGNQQRNLWILTRSKSPSAAIIDAAKKAASSQGLDTAPVKQVDQQHC